MEVFMALMGITGSHIRGTLINNGLAVGFVVAGAVTAFVINFIAEKVSEAKKSDDSVIFSNTNARSIRSTGNFVAGMASLAAIYALSLSSRVQPVAIARSEAIKLFGLQATLAIIAAYALGSAKFLGVAFTGLGCSFGSRALVVIGTAGTIYTNYAR
jgi:hypothetical protein